jgi:hypothetical protein
MSDHDRLAETLATLRSLCSFDVRTLFNADGSLLPAQLWPSEASLAIVGITSRELFQEGRLVGVEHKVRLSDRTKALALSLQELGLLTDRLPPTDPDEHAVLLRRGVISDSDFPGGILCGLHPSADAVVQRFIAGGLG